MTSSAIRSFQGRVRQFVPWRYQHLLTVQQSTAMVSRIVSNIILTVDLLDVPTETVGVIG